MATKIQNFRHILHKRDTDLQRLYNFEFSSIKLRLFYIQTYIIAVSHPYFNFTNSGEYKGLISSVAKPNEITISFLEDDKHTVNSVMEIWDGLKWNKNEGIIYPKTIYEDEAILTYLGAQKAPQSGITYKTPNRKYILYGLFPINREPISLSYASNDIEILNVTFNVDDIQPFFIPFTDIGL